MLIFSFDAAVKNMGVSIVRINQLEIDEELKFKMRLNRKDKNPNNTLAELITIYKRILSLLDSVIMIKWTQVINLLDMKSIHGLFSLNDSKSNLNESNTLKEQDKKKSKKTNQKKNPLGTLIERTHGLKHLLHMIDSQFSTPDIVLVEYQMKQNDYSKNISSQVLYHYDNNHTYLEVVGPSLKNTISFSEELNYGNFIMKYSNYIANKKHAVANYNYFIKVFPSNKHEVNSKKKDDIADAFIMAFAYCNKQGLI